MSTVIWNNPNDPNPEDPIDYNIGTIGVEYNGSIVSTAINSAIDAARVVSSTYGSLLVKYYQGDAADIGAELGKGAKCPTYGYWAGQGWAGGQRLASSENDKIDWNREPCYNENIKQIETNPNLDPKSCISLVDAITKTHDWMYTQAENKKASGEYDEAAYNNALSAADVVMLQNIATALQTGSYISQTGIYNKDTQTWSEKTYTGTLDSTEKFYLKALVPVFLCLIYNRDDSATGVFEKPAEDAARIIKSYLTLEGTMWEDPAYPSRKNLLKEKDGIVIMSQERTSSTNAMIMNINSNSNIEPVNVYIAYGANSTKAADAVSFKAEATTICISGGTGNDEIIITGAKKEANTSYTFEIAGGSGKDTYKLDSSFSYKLIDNGDNEIYITGDNGDWLRVDNLFKVIDGTWESEDGSIKLVGKTITLANGNTITLSDDFQSGDFGIDLITLPTNPETNNPINGDLTPIDFDPNTEGIQTQKDDWGNVRVDTTKPWEGRADTLYDTFGNDSIEGGAGDDIINTVRGGADWIKGGAGSDLIAYDSTFAEPRQTLTDSIIEGGYGSDIILGHYTVSNRLFGDSYGEMEALIAAGETAPNSPTRGDFISDYYLSDTGQSSSQGYLYGSIGRDILINNSVIRLKKQTDDGEEQRWLVQCDELRRAA